ncbi:MAG TPA: 4-(cytidine 5'-diphospho)-2-C-methyl-D-erythritol kinase [bacterium]|nr:4-(cytidine 5'-diphospho)-2-C-methyl-D-erythritol kinase [bacterium]
MKTQGLFQVASPAKVTLHLRILRRRSDGYHQIRIALAPVALYDRLRFALGGAPGVRLRVTAGQPLGPPEQNLVHRAALAFADALGQPPAAEIELDKNIPAGAGLGGGSGDAAATLVALNRWHGHPLGPDRMEALARRLGADVPFFLEPRPAWAEGVGERLTPLAGLPPLELLVAMPPLAIATGDAYAAARAEADGGPAPTADPDLRSLHGVVAGLFNAFEPALLPRHPVLGTLKAALLEAGALGALLSGSGAAVFGVFADAATRDAAAARLAPHADKEGWRLLPCRTLHAHRYDFIF